MTIMPQPDVRSIGIKCNLLAVPPLKKLQCKDDITEESLMISLCSIAIVAYYIYVTGFEKTRLPRTITNI